MAYWFVGAACGGADEQTSRFIQEGIWKTDREDKNLDAAKSILVGDRIAIKSFCMRKHDLPFDNRGQNVPVMTIKAIGAVRGNLGDGRTLTVDWEPFDPSREWYFYANRSTVWRVLPGDWTTDALIGFAFEGKAQDIDRFRNAPCWRERFGGSAVDKRRFSWTRFCEAAADKLLAFRNRRDELIAGIHAVASRVDGFSNLLDHFADGSSGPLKDICPFTVMAMFNRGISHANRQAVASELASLLGVSEPVPDSFEGIPVLNNHKSRFFGFDGKRRPDDIDVLWEVFAQAIAFADSDAAEARSAFASAYDNAMQRHGVGWNLSIGLYWIRPWNFPTLDSHSQRCLSKKLDMQIGMNGPKGRCNADDYLAVLDALEARFQKDEHPVHSFPELSLAARLCKDDGPDAASEAEPAAAPINSYSVDDILADGCFVAREKLEKILERLRAKKNLILQGPPGTGKTWLAKRLAFALMGQRDDSKVRAVQFHPNLSYEDFVRGWRPAGDGKLALVDGPFVETAKAAAKDPASRPSSLKRLIAEILHRSSARC